MKKVYINGAYCTKFGELWDSDLRQLGVEAAVNAVKDSEIDFKDIDAIYVANMTASRITGQSHVGALFASELGLNCPAYHVEAACASGGMAVRQAYFDLMTGQSENILVIGVEKMTDLDGGEVASSLAGASDEEWEAFYGATFPSLYAMIAREHIDLYSTKREQMAACVVKNHENGKLNPKAQFRNQVTIDKVLNSTEVADPFTLFDCSPISDGAAAVILSSNKKSKVAIKASAQAQDSLALHDRDEITELKATKLASKRAFKDSHLNSKNINIAEVHDCFSIAEILAYEDLGFVKKGKGGEFAESGKTKLDGQVPFNTSGGLKACGHPVGATGVKQIVEIYDQMLGRCGDRQVQNNLKFGLTHNVGGTGATAVVHILENLNA